MDGTDMKGSNLDVSEVIFLLNFTQWTDKISAYVRVAGRKADFQILRFLQFSCYNYHSIVMVIKGWLAPVAQSL